MNRPQQNHCKQCGRIIYFEGICVPCRHENEKKEVLALTPQEVEEKIEYICANFKEPVDLKKARQLCTKLIHYRDINTEKIAKAAWEQKIFQYPEIYKDASGQIVDEMIEMLTDDDLTSVTANSLLRCLAVAGGEKVFQVFWELEQHPRKWREHLYVNPSRYAMEGGWSYDSEGNFRKTIFEKCYPLVKGSSLDKEKSPVKIGVRTKEKCPRCGHSLVNLMEIDGRDPRLHFLGIDGIVKAKCCPSCFLFLDGSFCHYEINGESAMMPPKEDSATAYFGEEGMEIGENTYVLGDSPVPLRYAADWDEGSSVGGFAFWIQDCDIKICPDCGKPMTYLAQIQWDTIVDGMEGNAYIEICKDCKTIAVLHQQT